MNLVTLTHAVLRRWWLVVLFGLCGIPAASEIKDMMPPRYSSTVSLQLNPAATSAFLPYLANSSTNPYASPVQSMASSYREMLRTRSFGEVVVSSLNLRLRPEALAGSINTQLVPSTNILRLTVTWDNPRDAEQLAQRIAEIFIAENVRRQQAEPGTQARLSEMETSARNMQARVAPLEQQRQRLDEAVSRGDLSRLGELTELETRLAAVQAGYASLLIEINRVRSSFDTAVILDNATPGFAVDTVSTQQALAFGLVGGLAVGAAVALILEYLADALRSPRDVVAVAGLAPIARVRRARTRRRWRMRAEPAMVMLDHPRTPAAEAFRSLRATLQVMAPAGTLRTLAISSAGPGEGKTFVACNLAIALAQSGKRVLLVDGDLRRPRVHVWFGETNAYGLADALKAHDTDVPDQIIESRVDNLWLLPAGHVPNNPGELLSGDTMARLLASLVTTWDMVIVDTAPVNVVADTLLLAHQVDGCLLVARAERTKRAALAAALAALRDARQVVFGVVLNDERSGVFRRFSHTDYYQLGYRTSPSSNGFERVPQAVDDAPVR